MRALAQRSAEAAKEIKALISDSSGQVDKGVDLVAETGRALERIMEQVTEINVVVGEIAAAAQEQSTALQEINTAIDGMNRVTQENAAVVEEFDRGRPFPLGRIVSAGAIGRPVPGPAVGEREVAGARGLTHARGACRAGIVIAPIEAAAELPANAVVRPPFTQWRLSPLLHAPPQAEAAQPRRFHGSRRSPALLPASASAKMLAEQNDSAHWSWRWLREAASGSGSNR